MIRRVLILCSVFLVLILIFSIIIIASHNHSVVSQSKSSWAIILGIGQYEYLSGENQYADKDAEEVAEQMRPLWGNDHVKLMVNSNVTKETIKDIVFNWLAPKENKTDTVMLFFAGHGECEYIYPYDVIEGSNETNIDYSQISQWLNVLDSNNIVVVLDSCGSGSFGGNLSAKYNTILTCGTKCQRCWQKNAYEHGIFSYYLIEALKNLKSVDINQDHLVSVGELFNYIDSNIVDEFKEYPPPSLQDPTMISHNNENLILFRTNEEDGNSTNNTK